MQLPSLVLLFGRSVGRSVVGQAVSASVWQSVSQSVSLAVSQSVSQSAVSVCKCWEHGLLLRVIAPPKVSNSVFGLSYKVGRLLFCYSLFNRSFNTIVRRLYCKGFHWEVSLLTA